MLSQNFVIYFISYIQYQQYFQNIFTSIFTNTQLNYQHLIIFINYCILLNLSIFFILTLQTQFQFTNAVSNQMNRQLFASPISNSNNSTPLRNQRSKKFMRKPSQGSERSSSKKSFDTNSYKESYIKTPTGLQKNNSRHEDFFVSLAKSIIKLNIKQKKQEGIEKAEQSDRTNLTQYEDFKAETKVHYDQQAEITIRNLNMRIKTLQAELDLRNHQASILSGECQRFKKLNEQQKQRRRILQNEKKQLSKELKEVIKNNDSLKIELKKSQKQRQHFVKQIQFFQRINYDDKTRSLQSYRQAYLEQQLQKMRRQFHKSRGERELQLQSDIKMIKQEKYTIESHMKALKLANQCLIKQINNNQEGLHDLILNSEQYKKLRQKYVRFLQEYKLLRNEYWSLKAESTKKGNKSEQSQIFSITASEIENDLSELKISNENTQILQYLTVPNVNGKVK